MAGFGISTLRRRGENYGVVFEGLVDVPADGDYTFTLFSNDAGRLMIDGQELGNTPAAFAQVCGLAENAVRQVTGSVALAKGVHSISVRETHSTGLDGFRVLWRGLGMSGTTEIPAEALFHEVQAERSGQEHVVSKLNGN